jgi:hypothetical protein
MPRYRPNVVPLGPQADLSGPISVTGVYRDQYGCWTQGLLAPAIWQALRPSQFGAPTPRQSGSPEPRAFIGPNPGRASHKRTWRAFGTTSTGRAFYVNLPSNNSASGWRVIRPESCRGVMAWVVRRRLRLLVLVPPVLPIGRVSAPTDFFARACGTVERCEGQGDSTPAHM